MDGLHRGLSPLVKRQSNGAQVLWGGGLAKEAQELLVAVDAAGWGVGQDMPAHDLQLFRSGFLQARFHVRLEDGLHLGDEVMGFHSTQHIAQHLTAGEEHHTGVSCYAVLLGALRQGVAVVDAVHVDATLELLGDGRQRSREGAAAAASVRVELDHRQTITLGDFFDLVEGDVLNTFSWRDVTNDACRLHDGLSKRLVC